MCKSKTNIQFKFGEKIIDYNCQDKVYQFMGSIKNPLIDVILPKEEILIIFNNTKGLEITVSYDKGKTISQLIKSFLHKFGRLDLLTNKKNVQFLYNDIPIDSNCQDKVGNYFSKKSGIPIIIIIDTEGEIKFFQN